MKPRFQGWFGQAVRLILLLIGILWIFIGIYVLLGFDPTLEGDPSARTTAIFQVIMGALLAFGMGSSIWHARKRYRVEDTPTSAPLEDAWGATALPNATERKRPEHRVQRALAWFFGIFFVVAALWILVDPVDWLDVSVPTDDPASTLESYSEAYNAGDIDAVMELFSEESVIIGHPIRARAAGLTAIRVLYVQDLAAAASEDAYMISSIEVSGTAVEWDAAWTNSGGDRFCSYGQIAGVEDGVFLLWIWPGSSSNC